MTEYTGVICDGEHHIALVRDETYVHLTYTVLIRPTDGTVRRQCEKTADFCMPCWGAFLQEWAATPMWLADVVYELRNWQFPACQHRPNAAVRWATPCSECL